MSKYDELVKSVMSYYTKDKKGILGGHYSHKNKKTGKTVKEDFFLKWCEECKEINLWTYWQGRNNPGKKAKILLLGQDWATPWEDGKHLLPYLKEILKSEKGCSERYIAEIKKVDKINDSPTDRTLSELMRLLGKEYDPYTPDNKNLFFTNLCLGYRTKGASGGLSKSALKHDVDYIIDLIEIVSPQIIICLGKDTYDAFVSKTKCKRDDNGMNFYEALSKGKCHAVYNDKIHVFGQAHTGRFGVMNRKRFEPSSQKANKSEMELLEEDWKRMKDYLK